MGITLEQFKALKPGDKVRIINIDNGRPNHWNWEGKMDKHAGNLVTFKEFCGDRFRIEEDSAWGWKRSDIDYVIKAWPKENPPLGKLYKKEDAMDSLVYRYMMRDCALTRDLIANIKFPKYEDVKPLIHIDKVIFNAPATIVFWKDGTKTVVKAGKDEYFDKEKGLAMAISKKVLGNKGNYYNTFKKHDAIDDSGEVYVPLSLLKECTTLKKLKSLIKFMED